MADWPVYGTIDGPIVMIGFGSVGIHGEKRAGDNILLSGGYEQTVRGNTINAP